jgi:hypothetical protein
LLRLTETYGLALGASAVQSGITAWESQITNAPKLIQKKPSIWLITAALIASATQMRPSLGALVGIIIQAALQFLARYFAEKQD